MIPSISDAMLTRPNKAETAALSKTDQYSKCNEIAINKTNKVISPVMNLELSKHRQASSHVVQVQMTCFLYGWLRERTR